MFSWELEGKKNMLFKWKCEARIHNGVTLTIGSPCKYYINCRWQDGNSKMNEAYWLLMQDFKMYIVSLDVQALSPPLSQRTYLICLYQSLAWYPEITFKCEMVTDDNATF